MKNIIVIVILVAVLAAVVFVALPQYNKYLKSQLMTQADDDFKTSNYTEAKKKYLRILEINPNNPEAIGKLGKIHLINREFHDATDYYLKGVKLQPQNSDFVFNLAQAYYKLGKTDEAEEYYQKTMELDKKHPNAARRVAVIEWDRGNKEKAIEILKQHAEIHPPGVDPPTYKRLGEYLHKMNKDDEAISYLEKLMELEKPPKQSIRLLVKLYYNEKDPNKADRLYEKMLTGHSDKLETYIEVSSYYEKIRKDKDKAESVLLLSKDNIKNRIEPYLAISDYYSRNKEYDKGLKILEQALAIEPNSNKIYFSLGLLYYDAGKYQNAETELKRAMSIRSDESATLNMMAWLYLTAPEDSGLYKPKEALKLARRAISYAPESPAIVDTLARAYLVNGKYDESILRYKENISGGNTLEYANYGLALCYYKQGKEKQAKEHLEKALQLGFKDEKLLQHDKDIPLVKDDARLQQYLNKTNK